MTLRVNKDSVGAIEESNVLSQKVKDLFKNKGAILVDMNKETNETQGTKTWLACLGKEHAGKRFIVYYINTDSGIVRLVQTELIVDANGCVRINTDHTNCYFTFLPVTAENLANANQLGMALDKALGESPRERSKESPNKPSNKSLWGKGITAVKNLYYAVQSKAAANGVMPDNTSESSSGTSILIDEGIDR